MDKSNGSDTSIANVSAFEVDDAVLPNLREYALANSLYWALAEGHACEISVSELTLSKYIIAC